MQNVAIPEWEGRVSPVFDVARQVVMMTIDKGVVLQREGYVLAEGSLSSRSQQLADRGVNVLICGGVSDALRVKLEQRHIRILPHRCGPVDEVLRAFLEGRLDEKCFSMPGCHCGQRRGRGGLCCGKRPQKRRCNS